MNVHEFGEGPAVLIIHGSPSPVTDLLPLAHRLAHSHHVLVPELPGYGASPPVDDFSFDHIGNVLSELLAARSISHTRAIIGFSSGGYRALDLVLRRHVPSDLVIGLGTFATLSEPERELFRTAAASLRADPSGTELKPILPERWLSESWRRDHPADEARVAAWIELSSYLHRELEAEAEADDLRPLLWQLPCPLYLRVGEFDRACPVELSAEIARLAPRALLEVVSGCGHALLIEDAAGTIDRIAVKLAQLNA